MGRLLALDLGTKRVGLAVTDPLKMIASPLSTLTVTSEERLLKQVLDLVGKMDIELVIIGYPLHQDGRVSPGCQHSRNFALALNRKGIQTVLWDERYSSLDAADLLREAGLTRKKATGKLDRIAASFILRDYLESQPS